MKKAYLLPVLTAVVASQAVPCFAKKKNAKPNFVIIYCDDMGYGDIGCFGSPTIKTPNIDKMATEGMKLTSFYSAASCSTPSRAALMTGRYPVRNGVYGVKWPVLFPFSKEGLAQDEFTIAKLLKQGGYATACVGKWHLGSVAPHHAVNHGFDEFFGVPVGHNMVPPNLMIGDSIVEPNADLPTLTPRFTEYAVNYIKEHHKEPFFLYFAQVYPHLPLHASEAFKGKSTRGIYGDTVEEIDWSVGEVLKALKKYGVDDNTIVVFTSDHGPWKFYKTEGGHSGPFREGKWTAWEGGHRVPAVIRMPGKIKPSVQHGMMSSLDILPTFLSMAGVPLPEGVVLDGYDQKEMLLNGEETARDVMYFWRSNKLMAVRKGPWKLHLHTITNPFGGKDVIWQHGSDAPILYNVDEDISEEWNVAAQHPDIVKELEALASEHLKNMVMKEPVCDITE